MKEDTAGAIIREAAWASQETGAPTREGDTEEVIMTSVPNGLVAECKETGVVRPLAGVLP